MKSWPLTALKVWAKLRPPGYFEEMLSHGTLDGDVLMIDDEMYERLRLKYQPLAVAGVQALARHASSGFAKVDEATLASRKAACLACPQWDADGFSGLGRCRRCGCSGIKLTWAAERCPLGQWDRVDTGSRE